MKSNWKDYFYQRINVLYDRTQWNTCIISNPFASMGHYEDGQVTVCIEDDKEAGKKIREGKAEVVGRKSNNYSI